MSKGSGTSIETSFGKNAKTLEITDGQEKVDLGTLSKQTTMVTVAEVDG
jgi:hypothetical protein